MKKFTLIRTSFLFCSLLASVAVWGQTTIFHQAVPTFTGIPLNWTANNGGGQAVFQSATGGYLLVDHIDDWVESETYDLSHFTELELTLDIASYGSGDHNPLTIEISSDGGSSWMSQVITTNLTTGTTYVKQGPYTINVVSETTRFRFRRNASSGRGVRFRNILLIGQQIDCADETFTNLPTASSGSYLARIWTGDDGLTWTAQGARTDQTIEGKAICWGNSGTRNLVSPVYENGIGLLEFQFVRAFTGTSGRSLEVWVNNLKLADITVSTTSDDIQFFSEWINIPGPVQLEIRSTGAAQVKLDNLSWTCYVLPSCLNTTQHYRSTGNGFWQQTSIWETSADGEGAWHPTPCPPDFRAAIVTIQSGNTISINSETHINNLFIAPGATLSFDQGSLSLLGDDQPAMIVAGVFDHNSTSGFPRIFSNIEVLEGGIINVRRTISGISIFYAGTASQSKVQYHTGAIFQWDLATAFSSSYQTYFPDADEETIPIFRITKNITAPVGASDPTVINGVFEANGNITWQNSGEKSFRNGLTGTGLITQSGSSGIFRIEGTTAVLGGSGTLSLNAAGLEIASPNLTLTSSKTIEGGPLTLTGNLNAGPHTLTLRGDLVIAPAGTFQAQSSTLAFAGTTLQAVQLTNPLELFNLRVSNPQGISINHDLSVAGLLEMNGGNIHNPHQTLSLGSSVGEPGAFQHTSGLILGSFQRWATATASTWLFPIGEGLHEATASITYTTAPTYGGTLTATFVTDLPEDYYGNLPLTGISPIIDNLSKVGYWKIVSGNGLSDGIYNLSLLLPLLLQEAIAEPDSVRIVKRPEGGLWAVEGAFAGITDQIITHTGLAGFSDFAIGSNFSTNPLPIELLHFAAHSHSQGVWLEWTTASEIQNDFFTLVRSHNTTDIEMIGTVAGAGYSTQPKHYRFLDPDPLEGVGYYRLKQTDFDGTTTHSPWVAAAHNIQPNPLQILRVFQQEHQVVLLVQSSPQSHLHLWVHDIHGRELLSTRTSAAGNTTRYSFSAPAKGLLVITVSDGHHRASARVVVQ